MSDLPPDQRAAPDPLVGYRSNEEWQTLLAQFATLAQSVEAIPDDAARANVMALLQATDAIHREALHRLVRLFKEGVLEQVVTDPAIHTLMSMYDLLPETDPACRKMWDFIDEPASPAVGETVAASGADEQPRWMPLPADAALAEGQANVVGVDDRVVIVARVEGQSYALSATCPTHDTVMTAGRLSGFSWICPAGPACVYDVRNGSRLGGGAPLTCHPVRAEGAKDLRIGFGMPFTPHLPAF